jgi:hypothetical protein
LLRRSSIGRGDDSEEIAARARRLVRENGFSPPRFLSALDKDWYADVELCELPAGQRVLVPALQAMLPNRPWKPS